MRLSASSAQTVVSSCDYILLDIDGVLWSGDHVFPKIPETIQWLRSIGKKVRFLSNNSTMTRAETCRKFVKKGIANVKVEEVYTSAYVASLYLQELAVAASSSGEGAATSIPRYDKNVFVIGMPGLHEELRQVLAPGRTTYGLELNNYSYNPNIVAECRQTKLLPAPAAIAGGGSGAVDRVSLADLDCGAVVAGLDFSLNMSKIACASLCLQPATGAGGEEGDLKKKKSSSFSVSFIATNEDPQLPVGDQGALLPGAGSIINALSTVAGRRPDIICGKPELRMAEALFKHEGIKDPSRCLMVGDRLSTDIAFGNGAGCRTLLVLTGCETEEDVRTAQAANRKAWIPQYIADSLADLMMASNSKL